jgi:hypothetical protein
VHTSNRSCLGAGGRIWSESSRGNFIKTLAFKENSDKRVGGHGSSDKTHARGPVSQNHQTKKPERPMCLSQVNRGVTVHLETGVRGKPLERFGQEREMTEDSPFVCA